MDREVLIQEVQRALPIKRWNHTLGVMSTAVKLALKYGVDDQKADLAALLHDYAKYWSSERLSEIILQQGLPQDLLEYDKELWHGPVGAYITHTQFGIEDEEVLDAIRYHTSGRPDMTLLDKIVCLADYMEPGRDFPGVNNIRELAEYSIEKALLAGLDSTIQFLVSKGKKIYPMTLLARNSLIDEIQKS